MSKKYLDYVSSFDFETSEYFSYPTTCFSYNSIFNKAFISDIIPRRFENSWIMTPIEADKLLKQTYGEYMALPPEEKRVGKHFADAFSTSQPYSAFSN